MMVTPTACMTRAGSHERTPPQRCMRTRHCRGVSDAVRRYFINTHQEVYTHNVPCRGVPSQLCSTECACQDEHSALSLYCLAGAICKARHTSAIPLLKARRPFLIHYQEANAPFYLLKANESGDASHRRTRVIEPSSSRTLTDEKAGFLFARVRTGGLRHCVAWPQMKSGKAHTCPSLGHLSPFPARALWLPRAHN